MTGRVIAYRAIRFGRPFMGAIPRGRPLSGLSSFQRGNIPIGSNINRLPVEETSGKRSHRSSHLMNCSVSSTIMGP